MGSCAFGIRGISLGFSRFWDLVLGRKKALNEALLNPYFLKGGTLGGDKLTSHECWHKPVCQKLFQMVWWVLGLCVVNTLGIIEEFPSKNGTICQLDPTLYFTQRFYQFLVKSFLHNMSSHDLTQFLIFQDNHRELCFWQEWCQRGAPPKNWLVGNLASIFVSWKLEGWKMILTKGLSFYWVEILMKLDQRFVMKAKFCINKCWLLMRL